MSSRPGRISVASGVWGFLVCGLVLLTVQDARGQLWLQTARVVTPVERGPMRVLLDTVQAIAERETMVVKRSPNADTEIPISELQSQLIDEEGIGIGSANHVFIDYRFSISSGSGFKQEVSALHFVYRPGPNQTDIPILYLGSSWMEKVLDKKGTPLPTNEAALIPFRRHLGFSVVARDEEATVVEIGGRTVREGFVAKKLALIQKVQRLVYDEL